MPLARGEAPRLPEPEPAQRLRVVSPRYGPDVVGGIETLMRRIAISMASAGWIVEVLTSCARDAATWANVERAGTERDGDVLVRRFAVRRPRRPFLFRQLSRGVFALPARLRPEDAWVRLQGPTSPALVAALAAGPAVPTLFAPYLYHPTLAGLPVAHGPRILNPAAHDEAPLHLRTVGRTVAATGALLYGTEEERDLLERVHPVARQTPSEVGNVGVEPPSGIDPRRFQTKHDVTGPYLLYGGRGGRLKGVDQLLTGVQHLRSSHPEVQLVLTGEAGAGLEPQRWMRCVGMLDDRDRWDALAGASSVVVPSYLESLSLLALEAWAVGRPVIVNAASPTLVGQVRRSHGGVTFRDPAELAAAASRLLDDPAAADALGGRGQAHVRERYRWPHVHARLERLIGAAATHRPS